MFNRVPRQKPEPAPLPAVHAADLWRIYNTGEREVQALRGLDLHIAPGQLVALKGRSGSGKTTLLNCLGGLDQPTRGDVQIFGEDIGGWSERQLTEWRRQRVGFIFQALGLLPALSAYENVELVLRIAGVPRRERKERAESWLSLVGLGDRMDHRPYEMSGGQQQRVAIARALANQPRLVLADEPTGELDSTTAREVLTLFQRIVREQQLTMLIATHDSLVDEYVDRVLHLEDGQVAEGKVVEGEEP